LLYLNPLPDLAEHLAPALRKLQLKESLVLALQLLLLLLRLLSLQSHWASLPLPSPLA
jgi:hypothetical protein